jgi:hypothetical protein
VAIKSRPLAGFFFWRRSTAMRAWRPLHRACAGKVEKCGFAWANCVVRELHSLCREEVEKGARMEIMLVFQILLLVALLAGGLTSWDRRTGKDRRDDGR